MPLPETTPGTVDALVAEYGRTALAHDPMLATSMGLYDRNAELADLSPGAVDAAERAFAALRRKIDEHAAIVSDPEDEVDRRGLATVVDRQLDWYRLHRTPWRNPLMVAQAATSGVLFPLMFDHIPEREAAIAGRLGAMPAYLDQAGALIEPAEVPPLWCRLAQASAGGGATFLGEVVPATFPALEEAGRAAAGAMRSYAAWLAEEVAPVAAGSYVLGEDGLRQVLERVHLLPDGPAEVMARGRALLERGEAALREAAAGRDWREALTGARSRGPAIEALVPTYRKEVEALRAFCFSHDLVTDPDAPAEVHETPAYLRPIMGYAAYLPTGAFDPARSGKLWVTPPPDPEGLADHSYAAIQPIAAHEGYPGHHLQLTSVNRLERPARRLRDGSSLMIEGWGLYVEELMHEVGYYTPEGRMAQLAMTQWRAARIVADMGLHTGELGVDEAIDLLVDRAGITRVTATTEVSRYTMTPTQPFTYLYGAEEIRRIRKAWIDRTAGSLRAFHDKLLGYGNLPPALVAERMLAGGAGA
jgi:uncharacterized protein (DUF885 family)